MKLNQTSICIKSGLPLSSHSICRMCRRSCRLAGSRGKRYARTRGRKIVHKLLVQ